MKIVACMYQLTNLHMTRQLDFRGISRGMCKITIKLNLTEFIPLRDFNYELINCLWNESQGAKTTSGFNVGQPSRRAEISPVKDFHLSNKKIVRKYDEA